MNTEQYNKDFEAIVLLVAIPSCEECRVRIQKVLEDMRCWKRVEIGYPTEFGSKIWLLYETQSQKFDYWEKAKEAKEILELYHYKVL